MIAVMDMSFIMLFHIVVIDDYNMQWNSSLVYITLAKWPYLKFDKSEHALFDLFYHSLKAVSTDMTDSW